MTDTLSDIRGRHIHAGRRVRGSQERKRAAPVEEGNVRRGAPGQWSFGWKGGYIGELIAPPAPPTSADTPVGVLVAGEFRRLVLTIAGAPRGAGTGPVLPAPRKLQQAGSGKDKADGSCMIGRRHRTRRWTRRNLKTARRRGALLGMARTGGSASNGSGDYAIAFLDGTAGADPCQ